MMLSFRRRFPHRLAALFLLCLLITPPRAQAYSVLTHEQIVDFLWDTDIKKLLLERYPATTPDELKRAHAFAYGGCLIQDMGYYPAGNKFFSDLVHYVRSGDFVVELIRQSRDVNELAFALGALSHYASDISGHPAVNGAVAIIFPKLRARYGNEVTYADDPKAHIQTEFGFDVYQVYQQRYTSEAYRQFIGFEVAKPLLDRTFSATYGINIKDVFSDEERSIESYRHAVGTWIPQLTRVALVTKKKELEATPNFNPKQFRFLLSRTQYEKNWGKNYDKPGFGARLLAFIVRTLPKIGPLRALDIKPPTAETEKMYVKSVEETARMYRSLLRSVDTGQLTLSDLDLDTGKAARAGEYVLTDKAYARLLRQLAKHNFANLNPQLRANVLAFYSDLSRPIATKKHKKEWEQTLRDLQALKMVTPANGTPALGGR